MAFSTVAAAVAGPLIGGLLGGSQSKSGTGQQSTATKEPWAEAAPWLKDNIKRGQELQAYYQQNPFNAQQQTGYQNTFNDLNNFRSNMAPGLMNFADRAMNGPGYQRQQLERPGQGGYGPRPAMPQQPGLLAGTQPSAGLMSAQYAPVDFKAQMPQPQAAAPVQAAPVDSEEEFAKRMARYNQIQQENVRF